MVFNSVSISSQLRYVLNRQKLQLPSRHPYKSEVCWSSMWNYIFSSVGGNDLFSWRLRGCKSWEGKSWWWRNMKIQPLIYQVQAPFAARNELTDSACNPPTYFSPYTMIQDRNQIFGDQRRCRENMRINCDMPRLLRSSMYVISHCDFFTAVYCWLGFSGFTSLNATTTQTRSVRHVICSIH